MRALKRLELRAAADDEWKQRRQSPVAELPRVEQGELEEELSLFRAGECSPPVCMCVCVLSSSSSSTLGHKPENRIPDDAAPARPAPNLLLKRQANLISANQQLFL